MAKTDAELDRIARDLKRLVDPELALFAIVHGEPASPWRCPGLAGGEFSWVLEDNVNMRKTLENMGARRHKTCRIYERSP